MDDLLRLVGEKKTHDLILHRQGQRLGAARGVVAQMAAHLVVLQGVAEAHDAEDFLGGFRLGVLRMQHGGGQQGQEDKKTFHEGEGKETAL